MGGQAEDDIILGQRYNVLDKFYSTKYQADHGFVKEMHGEGEQFAQCNMISLAYAMHCNLNLFIHISYVFRFQFEVYPRKWFHAFIGFS